MGDKDIQKTIDETFDYTEWQKDLYSDLTVEELFSAAANWKQFKKYKGIITCDIDEKAELARARDEKYTEVST